MTIASASTKTVIYGYTSVHLSPRFEMRACASRADGKKHSLWLNRCPLLVYFQMARISFNLGKKSVECARNLAKVIIVVDLYSQIKPPSSCAFSTQRNHTVSLGNWIRPGSRSSEQFQNALFQSVNTKMAI